jgi:Spy/CpxP family protein refolding chaperone
MNQKVKVGAVLAGVFLLGGVSGAFAGRAFTFHQLHSMMSGSPRQARAHFRVETMRHELDLDDDQTKRIEAIFAEADPERDDALSGCKPKLDEIRSKTEAKIEEVLRPDQRAKFEELSKKRSAR